MLCYHWYLKDVGFNFEPHVKNIALLNIKGVDFRCIL